MANIVQRLVKGDPLTFKEHDDNFNNLNAELATKATKAYVSEQIDLVVSESLNSKIAVVEKGAANGVASLDSAGKVLTTQLPSYIDDVLEYNNLDAFPITGNTGKIYIAIDTNKPYRWSGSGYVYITSGAVDSVAGKTGVVVLTKADVGLGNVDNTADSAKPVSTAQANALALKANIASPALTGTPTAPTATVGTNTTQLATTAFVQAELTSKTIPTSHVGSVGASHGLVTNDLAGFMSAADKLKLDSITGTGDVISVAGRIGAVVLTKVDVGLGNVDNVADVNKPVSGLQQTALNLKANIASPALTGTPTAPTATAGTNTTQIATTAFVNSKFINDAIPLSHVGSVGLTHGIVTSTDAGFMSVEDKLKLDGISAGAGGGVTSVAGRSGAVVLTKADVGLSNVDNTADTAKPVSNAQATALALKANIASPALTGTPTAPTATAGTNTTQLATTAFVKIEIINSSTPASHVGSVGTAHGVATTATAGFMSATDKEKLDGISAGAGGGVTSVAGRSGVVVLTKADVGLGNVDNTADSAKPVSTAQANALALKANIASPALTGTPTAPTATVGTNTTQLATTAFVQAEIATSTVPMTHVGATGSAHGVATTAVAGFMSAIDKLKLDGISAGAGGGVTSVAGRSGAVVLTKADVGLSNVDNTADSAKPVSTVQQTALDLKANIASPTLTGIPAAPTATVGTNTTQLATTAFVNAEIANDAPTKIGGGASGTWGIGITGNAATATKLATARTINGVAFDGTANITLSSSSVENTVSVINANTTAIKNVFYAIISPLNLTLPLAPVAGDTVYFANRSSSKNVSILRNGQNIMGLAEDMSIDIISGIGSLVFIDATRGWILF